LQARVLRLQGLYQQRQVFPGMFANAQEHRHHGNGLDTHGQQFVHYGIEVWRAKFQISAAH
jgi:hypothetical protein